VEASRIYVLHLERKSRHNEGNRIGNGLANNETDCGDTLKERELSVEGLILILVRCMLFLLR
jgi:hypothetical protein